MAPTDQQRTPLLPQPILPVYLVLLLSISLAEIILPLFTFSYGSPIDSVPTTYVPVWIAAGCSCIVIVGLPWLNLAFGAGLCVLMFVLFMVAGGTAHPYSVRAQLCVPELRCHTPIAIEDLAWTAAALYIAPLGVISHALLTGRCVHGLARI